MSYRAIALWMCALIAEQVWRPFQGLREEVCAFSSIKSNLVSSILFVFSIPSDRLNTWPAVLTCTCPYQVAVLPGYSPALVCPAVGPTQCCLPAVPRCHESTFPNSDYFIQTIMVKITPDCGAGGVLKAFSCKTFVLWEADRSPSKPGGSQVGGQPFHPHPPPASPPVILP